MCYNENYNGETINETSETKNLQYLRCLQENTIYTLEQPCYLQNNLSILINKSGIKTFFHNNNANVPKNYNNHIKKLKNKTIFF
uniref:Uncharacterized protein n=1 Tax=Trichogramma kaykai TaxID=54128 RepID=A0ABD2VZN1_9HYME